MASTKNGASSDIGASGHRDAVFLHRFEHRGLRLWRGAIDFIGEHDVREDRPFGEFERAFSARQLLQNVGAR